jgi:hypothetical protein
VFGFPGFNQGFDLIKRHGYSPTNWMRRFLSGRASPGRCQKIVFAPFLSNRIACGISLLATNEHLFPNYVPSTFARARKREIF